MRPTVAQPHSPPHASQEVCSLARSSSRKKRTLSATLSFAVSSLQTCNVESICKSSWFGVESWDLLGVWVETGVKYDAVDYMLCIEKLFPNACIRSLLVLSVI